MSNFKLFNIDIYLINIYIHFVCIYSFIHLFLYLFIQLFIYSTGIKV